MTYSVITCRLQKLKGGEKEIADRGTEISEEGGAEVAHKQHGLLSLRAWGALEAMLTIYCEPTLFYNQGSLALHYSVMLLLWCLRGGL